MSIWKHLKERAWDGEYVKAEPPFLMGYWTRPPLKRAWMRLAELWETQPLNVVMAAATVMAAAAAVIALLR